MPAASLAVINRRIIGRKSSRAFTPGHFSGKSSRGSSGSLSMHDLKAAIVSNARAISSNGSDETYFLNVGEMLLMKSLYSFAISVRGQSFAATCFGLVVPPIETSEVRMTLTDSTTPSFMHRDFTS